MPGLWRTQVNESLVDRSGNEELENLSETVYWFIGRLE